VKLVAIFPWFTLFFALIAIGVLLVAWRRALLRVEAPMRKEEKARASA